MASTEAAVGQQVAVPAHLPFFITLQGETDWLLLAMMLLLVAAVVGIGVFYLKLHSLPEHMAHRGQKVQYEIVAVLALLALFTHNHVFWILGLLLALIPIPDFITPIASMAQSLGRMAEKADRTPSRPREIAEPEPLAQSRGSDDA
jgi:hypothetical protein